ncbi:MAG TPA: hypothetical protein PLM74_01890 [Bacillota bacterium]|nr:hypothetical protein [Bacillota bacterium]
MAQDIAIADLLTQEGFDTLPAFQTAREVLIRKGLTNIRKTNIHVSKLPRVREVLAGELYLVCSDPLCQTLARLECGSRQIVTVSSAGCRICGGKNSRRCLDAANRLFQQHGICRVVIVGGTGADHSEIARQARGKSVEFRFVDGTRAGRATQLAEAYVRWADLVIIWTNTPLKHSVSNTYTGNRSRAGRVVYANRTGVAAMISQVARQIA